MRLVNSFNYQYSQKQLSITAHDVIFFSQWFAYYFAQFNLNRFNVVIKVVA